MQLNTHVKYQVIIRHLTEARDRYFPIRNSKCSTIVFVQIFFPPENWIEMIRIRTRKFLNRFETTCANLIVSFTYINLIFNQRYVPR